MSQVEAQETTRVPQLSQYVVVEKIAVGGMAAIFVAQRKGSREICVIKTLHDHYAQDHVVANRFLREAQVAALLSHPNIARLTDAKREADVLYLAMEYIAGQDMETMMFKLMEQRRMLPPGLSLAVAVDVLAGLDYAHEFRQGEEHLEIVHRDLSPRNVMIGYDGQTKVIDFGLARTNLGEFRTAPGMVLGTLRYMSPEQATAEPVDRRSDIYSFGTVIYEALSGRPFVRGNDAKEIMHGILTQQALPLSSVNPDLPPALDGVLAKAMEKRRTDRYASATQFRDALLAAAPALCATPRSQVGDFVRKLYPDDYTRSIELMSRGAQGAIAGADDEEPAFEPTRAGVPTPEQGIVAEIVAPPLAGSIDDVPAAQYAPTQTRSNSVIPVGSQPMAAQAKPSRTTPILVAVSLLAVAALVAVFVVGDSNAKVVPEETPTPEPTRASPNVTIAPKKAVAPAKTKEKTVVTTAKRRRTRPRSAPPASTTVAEPPPSPPPPRRVARARSWKKQVDALSKDLKYTEAVALMRRTARRRLDAQRYEQFKAAVELEVMFGVAEPNVDKLKKQLAIDIAASDAAKEEAP